MIVTTKITIATPVGAGYGTRILSFASVINILMLLSFKNITAKTVGTETCVSACKLT